MTRRGRMWLAGAIAALVIGLVLWLQEGPPARDVPEDVTGARGALEPQGSGGEADDVASGTSAGASEGEELGEEPPVGAPTRREWIERAIRLAREERLAGEDGAGGGGAAGRGAPGSGGGSEGVGTLDPEYVRAAIQELKPLLRECYELAQREQADLEGRLVVEFEIVGEPDVGGIVDTSTIDDSSDLRHPALDECVRETIYTAELPAPEGGGRVTVRYPFDFSPE